jgi:chemotaxis protein histidine kinase CheA
MSDQSNVEEGFSKAWPFVLPNVAETVQFQMRALLQEKAELLDETRKIMAAWTKRRQEAMEASFRTFHAVSGCNDAGAMTTLYGEWLTNSMNRIFADLNGTRDEALRLAELVQKSVAALFRPTAGAAASTKNPMSSNPAGIEARRTKGAPPTNAAVE